MAFTRRPYTTLDDVKAALDKQTATDDTFISQMIVEAQDAVDDYLSFSFQTDGTLAAPADRTYDGNGATQLLIDRAQSITKVQLQTYLVSTNGAGAYVRTANPPTDITGDVMLGPTTLTPGFILTRLSGYTFPVGKQNVIVSGVFGYPAVPARIARATKLLAVHYVKQRDANYEDQIGSDQFGKPIFRKTMPMEVREILDRAKRPYFRMG